MLLIALASILYGSAMAFTTTDARLILGYSSVAQLGLHHARDLRPAAPTGAQGALLQAVNHGLVVAPAFFIVALLAARAGGSEDIRDMGGIAFRAPVLADAVPDRRARDAGDAGLVELRRRVPDPARRLQGEDRRSRSSPSPASCWPRLRAAAVHPRDAQPRRARRSSRARSALRDGLVLVPLVLVIIALALYPQLALHAQRARRRAVRSRSAPPRRRPPRARAAEADAVIAAPRRRRRPHIDWAGAVAAPRAARRRDRRAAASGLLRPRCVREALVPLAGARRASAPRSGWRSGSGASASDLIAGALRLDDLTLVARRSSSASPGIAAVLLSWRARRAARGRPRRVLRAAADSTAGMVVLVAAQNLVTLFLGLELLSIPLYVLCATEMRARALAGVGPEVPDHRLGRLGDAALRPGASSTARPGSTDFGGDRARRSSGDVVERPAAARPASR